MLKKHYKYLLFFLSPFSVAYSAVMKMRNLFFDKGFFKEKKVNAKIISVGNITVGGSGKTPTVVYLTKLLKRNGIKVGILSRGYGRKSKGYKLVSDGNKILASVVDSGDEIILAAEECKVPAAVSEKRVDGANKIIKSENLDAIVLDDAFQHRWIARDLNILIFDQRFLMKKKSIEQKPLPLGRMRESFTAVDRTDIILINRKFNEKRELNSLHKELFKNKDIFYAYYKSSGILDVKNEQLYSLEEFSGQKSLVVCGIARPFSFLKVLEDNGIDISNKLLFKDHMVYSEKEIQLIRKEFYETNSYSIITTQKDYVKLKEYATELDDVDIYYLKIDLVIEDAKNFDSKILDIIK